MMGRGFTIMVVAAALYAAGALVTFGHAAAGYDRRVTAEYAACMARTPPYCPREVGAPFAGLVAAVLWPLYWSWELQS